MARAIIDSTRGGEAEVKRWFEEGLTYREMVERYQTQYNLQVAPTMFSNRRAARGWDRRIVRDVDLIPWRVMPQHISRHAVAMLRALGRKRAGYPLSEREERELASLLGRLREADAVIHYEPDTEDGFFYVTRQPGDAEYVRPPKRQNRALRGARD